MNTTHRLTQAVMIAATLAAGFMAQASDSTAVAVPVVVMDMVQITGHRLHGTDLAVVQLPRVEVTGKRPSGEALTVVQLPRVEITGKRSIRGETQLAQKNLRGTAAKSVAPV